MSFYLKTERAYWQSFLPEEMCDQLSLFLMKVVLSRCLTHKTWTNVLSLPQLWQFPGSPVRPESLKGRCMQCQQEMLPSFWKDLMEQRALFALRLGFKFWLKFKLKLLLADLRQVTKLRVLVQTVLQTKGWSVLPPPILGLFFGLIRSILYATLFSSEA